MDYYQIMMSDPYGMPMRPYMNATDYYTFPQNFPRALELIMEAMADEKNDELFYEYLISIAPCEEDKKIIEGIRNDERKHFALFRTIYYQLTGDEIPAAMAGSLKKPASYCMGIQEALMGEIHAVAKYRNILYAMQFRPHINMMTEIITDEIRHASLYNYLYSMNACGLEKCSKRC